MVMLDQDMLAQRPIMDGAPPMGAPPSRAIMRPSSPGAAPGQFNPADLIASLLPQMPQYSPSGPAGISVPGMNISPFLSPDYGTIGKFGARSGNELQSMQNVSELARLISGQGRGLFDVGSPAYAEALKYYRTLLSGDRGALSSAIGPEAEAIGEIYGGAEKSTKAGGLRGGARDAALSDLQKKKTGDIASLVPKARQGAAAAATSAGLAGAQAGMGAEQAGSSIYDQLLGQETANRYNAIGAGQAQQGLGLQATLGKGQHDLGVGNLQLQDILGNRELGLKEYLGQAGLGMDRANFGLNANEFGLRSALGYGNLDLQKQQLALQQKQYQNQQSQQKGGVFGRILGTALGIGASFIPGIGPIAGPAIGGLIGNSGLFGGGGRNPPKSPGQPVNNGFSIPQINTTPSLSFPR